MNDFLLGDRLDVLKTIPPNSIDMVITSPPYNVGKMYNNHHDLMNYDEYLTFLYDTWVECYRVLKDDGRIAINIPSMTFEGKYKALYNDVVNQLTNIGFTIKCDILWYKQAISKRTAWGSWMSPSCPNVVQPYEFIFVFYKNEMKHIGLKENIDITRDEFILFSNSMWEIKPETRFSKIHPAPFPEELVYRLIKFFTYKYDVILDPFSGTGTVAKVCQDNNRNFIYIDNSSEYLEFAKKRLSQQSMYNQ